MEIQNQLGEVIEDIYIINNLTKEQLESLKEMRASDTTLILDAAMSKLFGKTVNFSKDFSTALKLFGKRINQLNQTLQTNE